MSVGRFVNVVEEDQDPTRTDEKRGEARSRKMMRKMKANVMRNATILSRTRRIILLCLIINILNKKYFRRENHIIHFLIINTMSLSTVYI